MAELARELAREQAVLDRALARLEVLRAEASRREKETLRGTGTGTPQAVYERDVQALNAAARRSDLDAAGEGLVFGRLDVLDGGPLHVGRLGLRTDDQEPIVMDWRAPAAAPFYQATAADPLGVVRRRTITCRGPRVLGVEDELLDADAQLDGTVVGDGAFLAAVGRERGPQMRDIVATIQREQDLAVRAPDDGALVVTGGPGTGKTAVALHRVAYLMYARRDWYGRRGVLVVGPSPVFIDYIGAVLPSLGETSVRLSDLGALPVLPRGMAVDSDDDARAIAVKGSARMATLLKRAVRHLATGSRLADVELVRWGHTIELGVEELLRRRSQVGRSPRSHNAGRTAFVAAIVDVAWRSWERRANAPRPEPGDREDFGRWLRGDAAFVRAMDRAWPVLEPRQVLAALRSGQVPLSRICGGLYDETEQQVLAAGWPDTSFPPGSAGTPLPAAEAASSVGNRTVTSLSAADAASSVGNRTGTSLSAADAASSTGNRTGTSLSAADAASSTGSRTVTSLSAADAAIVDELVFLLGPPPEPEIDPDDAWDELAELDALAAEHGVTTFADRNSRSGRSPALDSDYRTYAHVVVDEAQDVTPMQWRMLGRRARGATWTIVGDWAQSAWPEVDEVRSAMDAVLGKARVRNAVLSTNYRTTTEIASLAADVLLAIDPAAQAPDAVRSSGLDPVWTVTDDVVAALPAAVTALLASVSGTVGVVVPHSLRAAVRSQLEGADDRVAIVDTWQVKGLEYDGCVVVDPQQMVAEALTRVAGLRTLYVAVTRATQQLHVLSDVPLDDLLG